MCAPKLIYMRLTLFSHISEQQQKSRSAAGSACGGGALSPVTPFWKGTPFWRKDET